MTSVFSSLNLYKKENQEAVKNKQSENNETSNGSDDFVIFITQFLYTTNCFQFQNFILL